MLRKKTTEMQSWEFCCVYDCSVTLFVFAVEEMAAAYAGTAKGSSAGGAAAAPGGTTEATWNYKWV